MFRTFPSIAQLVFCLLILSQSPASAAQEITPQFIADELARTLTAPDSKITLTIAAPRQFVFDFLTQRVDAYVADARQSEFDHADSAIADQLAPGSDRIITMENGETLIQRFLRFDPPQSYAYFVDMSRSTVDVPLAYSVSRYDLSAIDADTTELQTAVVYQSSSRLLAWFVRRGFNNALERDFAEAARIIESEYLATQ